MIYYPTSGLMNSMVPTSPHLNNNLILNFCQESFKTKLVLLSLDVICFLHWIPTLDAKDN